MQITAVMVYSKRFGVNYFNLLLDGGRTEHVFFGAKLYINDIEVFEPMEMVGFIHNNKDVRVNFLKRDHTVTEVRLNG